MHHPSQLRNAIQSAGNSIKSFASRRGFLFIGLALACFGLAPTAQAAPRPDTDLGNGNTSDGSGALINLTTGIDNTGIGYQALYRDTTGSYNSALGFQALRANTTGDGNTANGYIALRNNTTGTSNTAHGYQALFSNTTGTDNTALGYQALYSNTTGYYNTANGAQALYFNTTGAYNTANGWEALYSNTTGFDNTANGFEALALNTTGFENTADGFAALNSNTTGNYNIALGILAGRNLTTGDNNIDVGNPGVAAEANTIRIGTTGTHTATFVAGISGAAVVGDTVVVDANGHLGTVASSQRFKEKIKPMDKASEAILALKPVTFRYKHELDPQDIPQFGLVAEEVEKVNPALVGRDADGKVYTVRYEAVNAMLLNEFLKQHRQVQELETSITELKSTVTRQEATIAQQQKDFQQIGQLSVAPELSKPAPQRDDNNQ